MRPALDEAGKLIPPPSKTEAEERVKQLRHECAKIAGQLSSVGCDSRPDYTSWVHKATTKMEIFRQEENQLLAWLAGYTFAQLTVHKEVTKLLDLVDLKVDLAEDEVQLLESIEKVMTQ